MNERIKELDAQAVEYAVGVCDANGLCHYQEYLQVVKEKFAELIVKECMEQVYYTREDKIDETISQNIKARMATHFGVEE